MGLQRQDGKELPEERQKGNRMEIWRKKTKSISGTGHWIWRWFFSWIPIDGRGCGPSISSGRLWEIFRSLVWLFHSAGVWFPRKHKTLLSYSGLLKKGFSWDVFSKQWILNITGTNQEYKWEYLRFNLNSIKYGYFRHFYFMKNNFFLFLCVCLSL